MAVGPRIINRYVFREITVSFLFCLAIFLMAGLIAGFLPVLQKVIGRDMGLTVIMFQVLINVLPGTLVTVLPLSMTIGILLGLGRLAADNEIAAIKSSGISVIRLLPPVLTLGTIGLALSLFCTLVLIPKGISEGRRLMHEALTKRVDAGIEERTFFDKLKNLILFVEEIDPATGIMSRVFIQESSQPNEVTTILAHEGKAAPDPEGKAFVLHLRNGTMLTEDRHGDSTGSLAFETYTFRYPLDQADTGTQMSLEEMSVREIVKHVERVTQVKPTDTPEVLAFYQRVRTFARMLIVQRFTYPLACLALAVVAFPLGVLNMGRSRLNNVSVGLVVVFAYYAFTLATERLARSGLAAPELVIPLPPLVFIFAGAYFMHCVAQERVPGIIRLAQRLILRIRRDSP
ncbi:MAG: LptF/LptG family permease [Desulfomonile tiedjei]|nr:LptF/LptG family permease [Desulfomonile tiedjei]